ncbi:MAG: ATP-binding protein [Bradyrhizobium sp.]|uniref:AlbA family DNA-binding domain-containing protein n=2 Tax=Bradyrhizobium sp. TaxID=376 RepID=UPI003C4B9B14
MLKLDTKAELELLHTGNVKEGLHLEYKASGAIDKKDDSKKLEMARDVSAFANADGGQIVYSMTEKDHEPAGLDDGVDAKVYPEIWFEQVLQQHVTPTIAGLRPRHVPLSKSMVAVVIDIPSTKGDPHQVSDGRYYRRHNFNRLIMEHYEIRDAIRRTLEPALQIEFELFKGDAAYKSVEFSQFRDESDPIALGALLSNTSNQPSMYTVVSIFIDRRVKLVSLDGFEQVGETEFSPGDRRHHLRAKIGIPGAYPVFKEMSLALGPFHFKISDRLLGQKFALGYQIKAPGCLKESHGFLEIGESGQMHLRMPPN